MKYLKYIFCTVLMLMMALACENTENFPVDLEELTDPENTGGFLRIISVDQGAFDLLDIPNSAFVITLEADDAENGGQLETVEFFVGFSDNGEQTVGDQPEASDPILMLDETDFTVNEDSGLPRSTITIPSSAALDALGLTEDDVGSGDTFDFRWVLNLDNGNSFTNTNTGSNVRTGAFFNSPFFRRVIVARVVPEDSFVGTYTMTQAPTAAGPAAAFDGGFLFDPDNDGSLEVELRVDPNRSANGRIFDAAYLPDFQDPATFSMILFRGQTAAENQTLWPRQGTGIGCGGEIILDSPDMTGTFTLEDDSQFTLRFIEDVTNDCGAGSPEVEFTFTQGGG